ncbi:MULTISPECIES: type I restriction endonuclease subunit R [Acidithiobacillus]|uniref:Type I restriction endonuclease subunit R n=4 Tax=Acidithiobacillus TaxID=119977 RepID=A0A179BP21_ACIFR|nr:MULTISPECIES: type I restriction endonuclease [Acidithiobacillus]MEB8486383.1 type I restriction endonuclease [Acidithiobacillus ferriphilus]MEB8488605.1 type I restriction endonuclease [Acidithiobacillus ferriphilus]MEB8494383.1 type I restriction endonuclease [Acidithiobacillus ferriphilus]MEB8515151.1 type I restriction endonuclease [Acidithiobacillus ferriphilus]MEB8533816.1 type I restriction endonuclease [Acidithiobacillus ferriphilus]
MSIHKEISFETEICQYLAEHGWLYAEGDAAGYDRARALFPADVLAWVQETQPKAWETLTKNHGAKAGETLLTRLRDQLDQRGTLDVLRHGIELLGLKTPLILAQFKPALAINEDILARYAANRLRVVRQLHYSLHNENSIDLGLFLNGLPVATVELKTDFTQSIDDAVDQYRFDRIPKPKGQAAEPLLSFPNGALVHFAVSNSEVQMVTKLTGPATRFLPFNQGNEGAAGNPPNPNGGHRTAYLWEQVWAKDSWLEILGRYLIAQRDSKKKIDKIIFPRFHQLDVTCKLQTAVLHDGPGSKYLIQHSAGSGKTNSIAWTAHFLAELHDAEHHKIFDTVLVVSDRNVIDAQLQEALFDFQRTTGVVATITNKEGSKSGKLAEALSGDKKIVVCTIQTFPFALEAVRSLAATQGKHFAVIADEAHSSQTGEAAAKLKALLSSEELSELNDGGEISSEDILAAQMATRAEEGGITFIAFTATPKNKTMELFGTRPDPTRKPAPDNVPAPFHVYSMRQAIEEQFILDVLQNYTSYQLAFKLAHEGREISDTEVDRSTAVKSIMGWVRLHPYNIAQKVQIVVEHFRQYVSPLLSGNAKAMVVVASRLEAVRWKLAIEKYIRSQGYKIGTLVAYSGEVTDPVSGPEGFTENTPALNPNLKGRDIREAFKGDEYQILLVANKFQTGFDQPLLCGMYVDKQLAGIQAVQTLSRLNRAYPGKDTTYVLDFVNDAEEVLKAFKMYYSTATLSATTDPNLVFNLRAKLDAAGLYDDFEVERVVLVELNPSAKQSELVAALEPVQDRIMKRYKGAQSALKAAQEGADGKAIEAAQDELNTLILFKSDMGAYLRLYTFLSQIFDYGNSAIEKRAIFYKRLLPLLEFGREREGIDLSKVVLTHHHLKNLGSKSLPLNQGDTPPLDPITASGSGSVQEKEKAWLKEIIEKVNELFDGELTDQDKLVYVNSVLKGKLLESETLRQQATNNTKEQFANSPDLKTELLNAIMGALDAHTLMSTQALNSAAIQGGLKDILLDNAQLYETLRTMAATR